MLYKALNVRKPKSTSFCRRPPWCIRTSLFTRNVLANQPPSHGLLPSAEMAAGSLQGVMLSPEGSSIMKPGAFSFSGFMGLRTVCNRKTVDFPTLNSISVTARPPFRRPCHHRQLPDTRRDPQVIGPFKKASPENLPLSQIGVRRLFPGFSLFSFCTRPLFCILFYLLDVFFHQFLL